MSDRHDEFYVGYFDQAPPGVGRWVRSRVRVVVGLGLLLAVLLSASQSPFAKSFFEFGEVREFEGWVLEHPAPTLLVERPDGSVANWLLVSLGKRGAHDHVAGLDGRRARVRGTLVHREDQTLVEVVADGVETIEGAAAAPAIGAVDLGEQVLRGEIVDSKCYLGVMKPGHLKPHRACATRCISGGIPPVLMMRDASGSASYVLLTGPAGEAVNTEVLPFVAEPVEIPGRLFRLRDRLVLHADPATIRRL